MPVIIENIPALLRRHPAWLVWRYVDMPNETKPRKVPMYVGGGHRRGKQGGPDDKRRLVSFNDAVAAYKRGGFAGLGFAMLPDWGLVGLDFDACVDEAGGINPEVEAIIGATYAEYSPSGRGVRAFMQGTAPDRKRPQGKGGAFGFETFHAKGFLTITGRVTPTVELVGGDIVPLTDTVRAYMHQRFAPPAGVSMVGRTTPIELSDPDDEELARGVAEDDILLTYAPPLGAPLNVLRSWLAALDPDMGRDEWLHVGMALHHEGGGAHDYLDLWDEWSRGEDDTPSTKYAGREDLERVWASFGRHGGKPVTARWLRRRAGVRRAAGVVILDAQDPMTGAKRFLEARFMNEEGVTLVRTNGDFYEHQGAAYKQRDEEAMRAEVWRWLDCCMKWGKATKNAETPAIPFSPAPAHVGAFIDALRAVTLVEECEPPSWLPGFEGVNAREIVSLTNGLLHVPTRNLIPHSIGLFNVNCLPYAWDPAATCPQWEEFLRSIWGYDTESIETLQEMFGYILTGDTSQQKMFLVIGPPRSGKGTIGRILGALVGADNMCSTSLTTLGGPFGLQPLLGKMLAMISDARLGGRNTNDVAAAVERLLSISGEDHITVDRKHKESWMGKLSARFLIMTNETPSLTDASGALARRFIVLALHKTFYGQEDHTLTERLMGELPGILAWALRGRDRLKARGYFVQPEAARESVNELTAVTSPVTSFVDDCCELGDGEADADELFTAWRIWCHDNGHKEGSRISFAKKLRAAYGNINILRDRRGEDGNRKRVFYGISLLVRV